MLLGALCNELLIPSTLNVTTKPLCSAALRATKPKTTYLTSLIRFVVLEA